MAPYGTDDEASVYSREEEENETQQEAMARMIAFKWSNQVVFLYALKAATFLGLPTILRHGEEALTMDEIATFVAARTGKEVNVSNLSRVLRLLASNDLVTEEKEKREEGGRQIRRYGASRVLKYLTTDDSEMVKRGSFGPFLHFSLQPSSHKMLDRMHLHVLDDCLGVPAFFENLSMNPVDGHIFNDAMANHSRLYMTLLLEQYDGFKSAKTMVDVGGGLGMNLESILAKYPHIHGINFDQRHVIEAAPTIAGVEHIGGNFFDSIPKCDTVFMKFILHDWSDEACVTLLKTIEKALPDDGRIINLDVVISENDEDPAPMRTAKHLLDVAMIAIETGGKERTKHEFCELGRLAGFSRVEVRFTIDYISVIEFYKR